MLNHESPDYLQTRLQILTVEHRDLDEAITLLATTPGKDELQLRRMKKRKLVLKDCIAELERQLQPDEPA